MSDSPQQSDDLSASKATAATGPVGTAVTISRLTVTAGDRALLRDASTAFPPGEVTLLLGCSGVGKSVLLRILAGLIDDSTPGIRFSGDIRFDRPADQANHAAAHPVAVVFQNFALLDELSPLQNVEIAIDHASKSFPSGRLANCSGISRFRPIGRFRYSVAGSSSDSPSREPSLRKRMSFFTMNRPPGWTVKRDDRLRI